MPFTKCLNPGLRWAGHRIGTPEVLFRSIGDEEVAALREQFAGSQADRADSAAASAAKKAAAAKKGSGPAAAGSSAPAPPRAAKSAASGAPAADGRKQQQSRVQADQQQSSPTEAAQACSCLNIICCYMQSLSDTL